MTQPGMVANRGGRPSQTTCVGSTRGSSHEPVRPARPRRLVAGLPAIVWRRSPRFGSSWGRIQALSVRSIWITTWMSSHFGSIAASPARAASSSTACCSRRWESNRVRTEPWFAPPGSKAEAPIYRGYWSQINTHPVQFTSLANLSLLRGGLRYYCPLCRTT